MINNKTLTFYLRERETYSKFVKELAAKVYYGEDIFCTRCPVEFSDREYWGYLDVLHVGDGFRRRQDIQFQRWLE